MYSGIYILIFLNEQIYKSTRAMTFYTKLFRALAVVYCDIAIEKYYIIKQACELFLAWDIPYALILSWFTINKMLNSGGVVIMRGLS